MVAVGPTGSGVSYAQQCAEEFQWYKSMSLYSFAASASTLDITYTTTSTNYTANIVTLCDGYPRVSGHLTPTATVTYTTSSKTTAWPTPPPICSVNPSDCAYLWSVYSSATKEAYSRGAQEDAVQTIVRFDTTSTALIIQSGKDISTITQPAPGILPVLTINDTVYTATDSLYNVGGTILSPGYSIYLYPACCSTAYIPSEPNCTTTFSAASSNKTCGACTIYGGEFQLMYFPITTNTSRNICSAATRSSTVCPFGPTTASFSSVDSPYAPNPCQYAPINETLPPDEGPYAVVNGSTFWANKAYISLATAYASGSCGYVGTTHTSTILTLKSSDIYSVFGYNHEFVDAAYSFDFDDLNTPMPAAAYPYIGQGGGCSAPDQWTSYWVWPDAVDGTTNGDLALCETIFQDAVSQTLAVPPQFRSIDPAWGQCALNLDGLYDPPYALTEQGTAAAPTPVPPTPAPGSSPSPIIPSPTATAGPVPPTKPTDPRGSLDPALSSNNPAPSPSNSPDPVPDSQSPAPPSKPVPVSPNSQVPGPSNSPVPSPSNIPVPAPPNDPKTPDPAPSSSFNIGEGISSVLSVGSIGQPGVGGSGGAPSAPAPAPASTHGGTDPAGIIVSLAKGGHPEPGSSLDSPVGSGTGSDPTGPGAGGIASPSESNPSSTGPRSGPGEGSISNTGSSSVNPSGDPQAGSSPQSLVSVGGVPISAAPGGSGAIIVASSTYLPGQSATIGGTPVSVATGGVVIPGSNGGTMSTVNVPILGSGSGPDNPNSGAGDRTSQIGAIISAGGQSYTVTPVAGSTGAVVVGGQIISPGGPAVILSNGQVFSAASSGIVIGTGSSASTVPFSAIPDGSAATAQETGAIITAGGQTFTVQSSGGLVIVGGETLQSGGAVATFPDGQVVSAGSSGLIVGSGSSATIASFSALPGATTTAGTGVIITAGGQIFTAQSSGGIISIDGQTFTVGGPAVTLPNGQVISAASSGIVVGAGSAAVTDAFSALPGVKSTVESGVIVTAGGQPLTAESSGSLVVVEGQTLTVGGAAVTLPDGQVVSADSTGIVVGTGTAAITEAFSALPGSGTAKPVSEAVLTLGGTTISASEGSSGVVVVEGHTLSPGGSAATIDGTVISAGTSGIVVGGTNSQSSTVFYSSAPNPTGSASNIGATPAPTTSGAASSAVVTCIGVFGAFLIGLVCIL